MQGGGPFGATARRRRRRLAAVKRRGDSDMDETRDPAVPEAPAPREQSAAACDSSSESQTEKPAVPESAKAEPDGVGDQPRSAADRAEDKPRTEAAPPADRATRQVKPVRSAPRSERVAASRKPSVPGGFTPALVCLAGGNGLGLALVLMSMPVGADGLRHAVWGQTISTQAAWPFILALGLGHALGFCAWGFYLRRKLRGKPPAEQVPPANDAARAIADLKANGRDQTGQTPSSAT
jgi:hypothetical protein